MQVTKAGLERVKSDDFKRSIFRIILELCQELPPDEARDVVYARTATALCADERNRFAMSDIAEMAAFMDANEELIKQSLAPILGEIVQAGMALGQIPSN